MTIKVVVEITNDQLRRVFSDLYTGQTIASYTYYADGRGRNPDNTPNQSSRWMYRRGSKVVLSQDYVKTFNTTKYTRYMISRAA